MIEFVVEGVGTYCDPFDPGEVERDVALVHFDLRPIENPPFADEAEAAQRMGEV